MMVYVAGASSEVERAERMIAAVRYEGASVTFDWAAWLGAGPHSPAESASRCIEGAATADLVIALVPRGANTTRGMWVELGIALVTRTPTVVVGEAGCADIWEHGEDVIRVERDADAKRLLRASCERARGAG